MMPGVRPTASGMFCPVMLVGVRVGSPVQPGGGMRKSPVGALGAELAATGGAVGVGGWSGMLAAPGAAETSEALATSTAARSDTAAQRRKEAVIDSSP